MRSNIRKYGVVKVKEMSPQAWANIAGIDTDKNYIKKVTGATVTDAVFFTETTDDGEIDWVTANQLEPYCIPASFVTIETGEME